MIPRRGPAVNHLSPGPLAGACDQRSRQSFVAPVLHRTFTAGASEENPTPDFYIGSLLRPLQLENHVYGRLQASHREDLAVPAHGYLLLTDLQALHSLGILVHDTHGGDFMAGNRLVDFSRAWTAPHPALVGRMERGLRELLRAEMQLLMDWYHELVR